MIHCKNPRAKSRELSRVRLPLQSIVALANPSARYHIPNNLANSNRGSEYAPRVGDLLFLFKPQLLMPLFQLLLSYHGHMISRKKHGNQEDQQCSASSSVFWWPQLETPMLPPKPSERLLLN